MSEVCKFPSGYAFEPSYYRIDGNYQLVTIKNVNGIFVDNQKIDCLSKLPQYFKPASNFSKNGGIRYAC